MLASRSTVLNKLRFECLRVLEARVGIANILFLPFWLLISGCSSLLVEQPKGPWAILKQETHQCLANLKSDPELKLIAKKVTLDSHYDRDEYFELQSIEALPGPREKVVIKKWATKLEQCYKLRAESYAYEPAGVALLSAASDSEQLALILELSKGNLSYGDFAIKRLELDTKYRGEIVRAISTDYKKREARPPVNSSMPPNPSSGSSSSCGWVGNQWICRSL